MKKHWYYITIYVCPVCGNVQQYRERMYTKKPKDRDKRREWTQQYDYCEEVY